MNFNDRIRKTRTPADEQAAARLKRDTDRNEREHPGPPAPPTGTKRGTPTISLDAAYVGQVHPDDIPQDSVTRREIGDNERKITEELTPEQREGVRVASMLASLARGRNATDASRFDNQPRRLGGDL